MDLDTKGKFSPENIRKMAKNIYLSTDDPESIFEKLGETFKQVSAITDGDEKTKEIGKCNKLIAQAASIRNLDNQILLSKSVSANYRSYVMEFAREIIKEFNCNTASEKALAQTIANAHVRSLEYSFIISNYFNTEYFGDDKTKYCEFLGKSLDRAQRDFISALTTLKQLKAPGFNINIKAEQALIAQNQQFNVGKEFSNGEKVIS